MGAQGRLGNDFDHVHRSSESAGGGEGLCVAQPAGASASSTPPATSGRCAETASSARSVRIMARPVPAAAEPNVPITTPPATISLPGAGGEAGEVNPDDALACRAAMLDARDDLLADKAALLEIDAMNEVEIGVVREGFAIGEVDAPLRNAERDAMGLVALGGAGFARRGERVERADETPAETAVARIAEGRDRIIGPPSLDARPPCGADTEASGGVGDGDPGAQSVERRAA